MSMVFQTPMTALNPVLRVERQITESLHEHLDLNKQQAKDTALALLTSVGIPEPARRLRMYPHEMSGGMRQRIMIAIALACGPRMLFADEPTTALDVTVQAQILDLLQELQRDRQMAMILVTHDLGVVAGRAHDIAVMYAGEIVEQASARALFANVRHPYTEALLQSIPKLEMAKHTKLDAIGGRPPDLVNLPQGCPFAPPVPLRTGPLPRRSAGAAPRSDRSEPPRRLPLPGGHRPVRAAARSSRRRDPRPPRGARRRPRGRPRPRRPALGRTPCRRT